MKLELISIEQLHADVEALMSFKFLGDPREVARQQLGLLMPADMISTTQCAIEHRKFLGKGGAIIDWRPEVTPYVPEIQDACDDPDIRFVGVSGPGRSGKTVAFENLLLKVGIYGPPQGMYFFMQSKDDVIDYVEERIEPFFDPDLHSILAGKVGLRAKDNTMARKRVDGQLWRWLQATLNTLRGKSAPLIGADEIDAMHKKVRQAILTLVRNRQKEHGRNAFAYFASHPDAGELDGITAIVTESDRRVWYWRCGHCKLVSSPLPKVERRMTLYLPDIREVPRDEIADLVEHEARLQCPHCRELIDNTHRLEINAKGLWVPKGKTIADDGTVSGVRAPNEIAGFTIHGMMLTHEEVTIGKLARAFVTAKLKFDDSGDDTDLRETTVKDFGEVYYGPDRKYHVDEWKKVRARLGDPSYVLGVVPDGARFNIGFVDVQGNRFECVVVSYDEYGESWLLDRFPLMQWPASDGRVAFDTISPMNRIGDWDILIPAMLQRRWPLMRDNSLGLGLAMLVIDAGGEANKERDLTVTYNARRWAAGVLADGIAKPWEILLTMGSPHKKVELLGEPKQVVKDERGRQFENPAIERRVNTFELKKLIVHRMNQSPPGALTMHLPAGLDDRYWRELCSEALHGDKWIPKGRNETFDGYVGCEVGRQVVMLAPDRARLDWDKKLPPYARPKPMVDTNTTAGNVPPQQSRYDRYARLNKRNR